MEASNIKMHAEFSKFTEEALDAVNKIYDLISKPCVFREEVSQACQQARAILYNPPITKMPPRNCDIMDWRTAWKIWREKFCPETPVRYSAVVKGTEAFMDWFTAPATEKEGETDGSK